MDLGEQCIFFFVFVTEARDRIKVDYLQLKAYFILILQII